MLIGRIDGLGTCKQHLEPSAHHRLLQLSWQKVQPSLPHPELECQQEGVLANERQQAGQVDPMLFRNTHCRWFEV